MPQVTTNGVTLEYEAHGIRTDPPLLLIMGLGAQLTLWPIEFVDALVERGFYVIRYDNRDIGLSSKFTHAGLPNINKIALMRMFGFNPRIPYRLSDMADDASGLLTSLGIRRAHVVGASMGGMIAQHLAIRHPGKVASLTSIMSTTGNPRLPRAKRSAIKALTTRPPENATLEQITQHGIRVARAIGSPAYPADEQRLKDRIARDYNRSFHPTGPVRQLAAIVSDGDRRKRLASVSASTMIIHGEDDPLVPVEGGRDTAASITGAKLQTYPGMGHDLPLELIGPIADVIASHAHEADPAY